jgi:hypothetical protein
VSRVILFFLLLNSFSVFSSEKNNTATVTFYSTKSNSLWFGDSDEVKFNNDGQTRFQSVHNDFEFAINKKIDFLTGLSFAQSEMVKGNMGGVSTGDKRSHLNRVSVGASFDVYEGDSFFSTIGIVLSHPGSTKESPANFISLNDGAEHIEFFWQGSTVFKRFSLHSSLRLIKKFNRVPDAYLIDVKVPVLLSNKVELGLGGNYVHSMSGLTIGEGAWLSIAAPKPFQLVKERYLGASLFGSYNLLDTYNLGLIYTRRVWGRNVDIASSLGFSFSLLF